MLDNVPYEVDYGRAPPGARGLKPHDPWNSAQLAQVALRPGRVD